MFHIVRVALVGVSLFGISVLSGCANKASAHKTQNITCLGFCTSTQIEHSVENLPLKENP